MDAASRSRLWLALAIVLVGVVGGLIGYCLGVRGASQPYTLELIASGGGTYVVSQRTGRIYAVEPYGEAEYVADIAAWDSDPMLRPGTQLRKGRPSHASGTPTAIEP
jgi:hypothetical protein